MKDMCILSHFREWPKLDLGKGKVSVVWQIEGSAWGNSCSDYVRVVVIGMRQMTYDKDW